MDRDGATTGPRERVAHAGLACVYALAAILGLFLHSTGESAAALHVCGERHADLERDDVPGRPHHDEARCALCHVFASFAVAVPPPLAAVRLAPAPAGLLLRPVALRAGSALDLIQRSRAPPEGRLPG